MCEREADGFFVAVYLGARSAAVWCEGGGVGGGLAERKYALSPGPSVASPLMGFAYGGPHARVSSPRVGCSILMTSALIS